MMPQDATSFIMRYFCINLILFGAEVCCYNDLFLQPPVKPAEVSALPQNSVLGLEHPVVLVGIEQQLCWYAMHTCRTKCALPLAV